MIASFILFVNLTCLDLTRPDLIEEIERVEDSMSQEIEGYDAE